MRTAVVTGALVVVCGFVMAEIRRPFGQRGRDKARPSKVESAFFTPPDFS